MPLALDIGTPIPTKNEAFAAVPAPIGHPVTYVGQCKTQWCWAACLVMIRQFFGLDAMTQYELAKAQFGSVDCSSPDNKACNQPALPDQAAPQAGLVCTPHNSQLASDELAIELGYSPVEVYFEFKASDGTASHVALITELKSDGRLRLLDPWAKFGESYPTIGQLQQSYHAGAWKRCYIRFEETP